METVKPIHTETVYSTPWCDLVAKTMREGESPYYSLRLPEYVGILAMTPDQRVIAVRQYRPAVEQFTLELPAGIVEKGEAPAACAARELLEETGYQADKMEVLGEMTTDTGRLSNIIWACFARGVHKVENYPAEADIETLTYSMGELMEAIRKGEFNHSLHVSILTLAAAKGLITIS